MYSTTPTQQFSTSSSFDTSFKCKYNLYTMHSNMLGYTVNVTSITNANITIYVEEFNGHYVHKNMLNTTGAVNVSVSTFDDMFILVIPLNDSAHASFNVSVINRPCTWW